MTTFSAKNKLTRLERVPVPMDRWHKDHWSMLAYLEVGEVDYHGIVDWDHVRVSEKNWGGVYKARSGWARSNFDKDGADYGLRVRGEGNLILRQMGHCEVDAIMDMVDAGLVVIELPKLAKSGDYYLKPNGTPLSRPGDPDPADEPDDMDLLPYSAFRLTERGREIENRLRKHKADGQNYGTFKPEV